MKLIKKLIQPFIVNHITYKISNFIIRKYDGDSNSDISSNGELKLLQFMLKTKIIKNSIFDIGANVGDYLAAIRRSDLGVKVYAFEPDPSNVAILKNLPPPLLKNTLIHQIALGDHSGKTSFYVNLQSSALNSIYNMKDIGYKTSLTKSITVDCVTLDDFCYENNILEIDFIKMDVEGHELSVLNGSLKMLEALSVRFIQFEYGHASRAAKVFLHDFVKFFDRLGYEIYIIRQRGLELLTYTPFVENQFNLINLLAARKDSSKLLDPILSRKLI
jgi:FkbM family methyltransferase